MHTEILLWASTLFISNALELITSFFFVNRYRAPGENWTTKFAHVVGILHTNYFQYALDQPAAIIRVSRSFSSCKIHDFFCACVYSNIVISTLLW